MKLKGINLKRIKPIIRKTMEDTLKKMKKTREKDTKLLRDKIKSRIDMLKTQQVAYTEQLKEINKQALILQHTQLKIKGALEVLNSLIEIKKKEK